MQKLFPFALTLHNVEEGVFMPKWQEIHSISLPFHPGASRIWLGLVIVTVAAFLITYYSGKRGPESIWAYMLFGSVITMLLNVFIPHVAATLAFRAYTPGVVTAVFLLLPFTCVLSVTALSERWVSGMKALRFALLVPAAAAGAILALFAIP